MLKRCLHFRTEWSCAAGADALADGAIAAAEDLAGAAIAGATAADATTADAIVDVFDDIAVALAATCCC